MGTPETILVPTTTLLAIQTHVHRLEMFLASDTDDHLRGSAQDALKRINGYLTDISSGIS